jgi:hypothetical protein
MRSTCPGHLNIPWFLHLMYAEVDKLRTFSVGNFFSPRFVFFSEIRIFCSENSSGARAGCRDVACCPRVSSSAVAVPAGSVWNLHARLCVFSWDSWLRFANTRPTGWIHAGRKGLGKYLKSVYVKAFLFFSLLLLYQLTNQLAQTFVCRSQCVLPSVVSSFFLMCFYSLMQSIECPKSHHTLPVFPCGSVCAHSTHRK